MNELMTVTSLGTFAGATAAVLVIIQVIKGMRFLQAIDTQLLTLIVALIVLEAVTVFTGGGVQEYVLAVFNSFLVALAAFGAYDKTFKAIDAKKPE